MNNIDRRKLLRFGEVVDALISKDYTSRGISHELYEDVREKKGSPLAMCAAMDLFSKAKVGDRVIIFTGWPSRSWLIDGLTETDGPVGAAIIARALEEAYGIVPILAMADNMEHFGVVALRSAGLIVSDLDKALLSKPGPPMASVGAVISIPTDRSVISKYSQSLLDKINPIALISIELPGANSEGMYHNVTGRIVPEHLVIKADEIFREATSRGILTIGIGDGGNELGMANATESIIKYLKDGNKIAPSTKVDHLIVSCISNWGALGFAACIAAVSGKKDIFDHIDIVRITDKLSDAGAIDGLTAYVDPKNDGTSNEVNRGLTSLLSMSLHMNIDGWNKQ